MIISNQQETPLSKRLSAVSLQKINKIIKSLIILIVFFTFLSPFSGSIAEQSFADTDGDIIDYPNKELVTKYNITNQTNLLANSLITESPPVIKKFVAITAYSSTQDQTDDTPFITASNTIVRDGVIAANFLPFGTKIRISQLFGNKIFIVEDRMHHRYKDDHIDIWFPTRESALEFGIKYAEIEILP